MLAFCFTNHAKGLTFAWNADPTPGISGYRLYYGTASRSYPNSINAGNSTTATVNGLLPGTTYYFAATSYTAAGMESAFSSEITYTMPASSSGVPTSGLVCNWKFDEGSGAVATDASGKGYNGKLLNSPTWTSGKISGALSFNGLNNAVSTPAVNLSGTRAVTVALWVNRTYSKVGGHALFESSTDIGGSTTGFMLFPDDSSSCVSGGMLIGLQGNAGYNLKCYAQPSSGVWHHLVAVFDKSQSALNEVQLYVDGILQTAQGQPSSHDNTNAFGNNPFYLMSRAGSGDFSSGVVDDFRIYNRALSANEIQQLYGVTRPAITLTSPPGKGAVASGTVNVAATATSSIGVQFEVDGVNLGSEDTSSPYQVPWNTATVTNGPHTISAVARDAAGNKATSTALVTVSNVPSQGLVGYWKMDEGSGSTAMDSSGFGINARLVNAPTWASGKINKALSFNGVNNAATIPALNLSTTRAVTVAMWVNRTYGSGGAHALIESTTGFSSSTTGFMMFPDDTSNCAGGGLLVGLRGNAGNNLKCYAQPSSGVWHHLVAVFDKSQNALNEVNLYIDGIRQSARTQSASSDNTNNFGLNPLYLMSRSASGDFCSGTIDDVRVYNRALSASEVLQVYSLGTVLNKTVTLTRQTDPGATATPAAPAIITSQSVQNGVFALTFNGDTGHGYVIEASPDAQNWSGIDIAVPVDGAASVTEPMGADYQFYRVRAMP